MKNFFSSLLTLFAFLILNSLSSCVYAQSLPDKQDSAFYSDFYVMQVEPMRFEMTYHYPVSDRVRVRILDSGKNVLFAETALVYKKYQKNFDMSGFNDGQYTFELIDAERKFNQSFEVLTRTIRTVTVSSREPIVVASF